MSAKMNSGWVESKPIRDADGGNQGWKAVLAESLQYSITKLSINSNEVKSLIDT